MATDSGSTTITAASGLNYVVVPHTLGSIPASVQITPQQDMGGMDWWVPTGYVTSSNFRLYMSSTYPSDMSFYWYAET